MGSDIQRLELEFSRVQQELAGEPARLREWGTAFVRAVSNHALRRIKANAPILKGDLRGDMQIVERRADDFGVELEITAPNIAYLYKQHEELTPAGPMKLGPVSQKQQNTMEGGVGGKFITRVFQYHSPRYNAAMVPSLVRYQRGQKSINLNLGELGL